MAASLAATTTFGSLAAGNQNLNLFDTQFLSLIGAANSLNNYSNYYADAGSANAYAITVPTSQTFTIAAGLPFQVKILTTNSTASTLQVTSGGTSVTKSITLTSGGALPAGALLAGAIAWMMYDGTQFQLCNPVAKQPTRTVLTSGTAATYTTPAGVTRINVRMVGGGGGGGAASTNAGSDGTDTTFGTGLTAGKGAGAAAGQNSGGAGGTATGGDINIGGGGGGAGGGVVNGGDGAGGNSAFGGGARGVQANAAGTNAATNSGGGGSGGVAGGAAGPGGGAGAYLEKLILAPAATYTYTVGAGGNGGSAGGNAGGNGAAGIIIIDEYYN